MRDIRIILIISEVLLVLLVVFPPIAESRTYARAVAAYYRTPSTENKIELERQRKALRASQFEVIFFIVALLAGNSVALWYISRRIKQARKGKV